MKRIFLIVLDSFGIGEMPDSFVYGDEGSNTINAVAKQECFNMKNMKSFGLFNIDGVDCCKKKDKPKGAFARMTEASKGKDTTIGHWEIAGVQSNKPLPTFPNGFPKSVILKFEEATGKKVLCNKPYSGTKVILDYGMEHVTTKNLIVYTSADSVFQIAAHEDVIPLDGLYNYCEIARNILIGEYAVGRVIARPFVGEFPNFKRTSNRHDFSLKPPKKTMLDQLTDNNLDVIAVGKINDIFAGKGISKAIKTSGNSDGIQKTIEIAKKDFNGLCFVNLVDFDMLYGHRNDAIGYAKALNEFDEKVMDIVKNLSKDDILMITADHGCDPSTVSTDHSREYTPFIAIGENIKSVNLGTRSTFADIAATIIDYFEINKEVSGKSFLKEIIRC